MKTVFITGGSRGIGKACVRAFALRGDNVYFTYNNSAEAADELSRETGAHAIHCDLRDPGTVCEALSQLDRIDVLVNNAGVSYTGLITDMSDTEYRDTMSVNLDAVFYACKAALPGMIRRGQGAIVNVSSIWGRVGASCEVAYSASKAGVIGLTRALAKEVGPSGVTVNCVAPGVIDTDMNAHLSDADMDALKEQTPMCRIGTPEEVAAAVVYLSDAPFVTGQILGVDGAII